MKVIQREQYMNKLRQLRDVHVIKVIVGVRRCGKSTLLKILRNELLASSVSDDQIFYMSFEEPETVLGGSYDWRSIYNHITARLRPGKMNYIFLDEIQAVPDFERLVNGLHAKTNVDLYITGSNAWFMSSQIATLLSGRFIEIKMLPYSFAEYVSLFDGKTDRRQIFQNYLNYGSFPLAGDLVRQGSAEMAGDYLTGLFNTVMVKDVLTHQGVNNSQTATNIARFVLDNVGNITSPNAIADTMTSDHQAVSRPTVANYLQALAEAFLIYPVERFDIKGRKLLTNMAKYYIVDTGLRRAVLGARASVDVGHLLENVIYLELLRRSNVVRIGRTGDKEVDFAVINREGDTEYYQVSLSVRDSTTLERELGSLRTIDDNNPKFLLTMDDEERNFDGIKQLNVINWLLNN